jgi:ABC-type sulfate transport system substrate-binding protein
VRVLSYNILDGGGGRADLLAGVIEGERPDVVAMVEADDVAVIEQRLLQPGAKQRVIDRPADRRPA